MATVDWFCLDLASPKGWDSGNLNLQLVCCKGTWPLARTACDNKYTVVSTVFRAQIDVFIGKG